MKHFNLTPGDSGDFEGVRVHVVSVGERQQRIKPYEPLVTLWLAGVEELEREAAQETSPAGGGNSAERKHFNLTPGDSRDYFGFRVRVLSVDARQKGSDSYKPVVTLCLHRLEELDSEGANEPSTVCRSSV